MQNGEAAHACWQDAVCLVLVLRAVLKRPRPSPIFYAQQPRAHTQLIGGQASEEPLSDMEPPQLTTDLFITF